MNAEPLDLTLNFRLSTGFRLAWESAIRDAADVVMAHVVREELATGRRFEEATHLLEDGAWPVKLDGPFPWPYSVPAGLETMRATAAAYVVREVQRRLDLRGTAG